MFYLIVMKIFFLASSFYVIYLMKFKFRYVRDDLCSSRVEVDIDTIRLEYLLGGSAVLALLFNYKFTLLEILWSFSIFLEAVAILPQMFLLQRLGEAETITTHYIFALGAYRTMYLLNWVYRYVASKLTQSHLRTQAPFRLHCVHCRSRTDRAVCGLFLQYVVHLAP